MFLYTACNIIKYVFHACIVMYSLANGNDLSNYLNTLSLSLSIIVTSFVERLSLCSIVTSLIQRCFHVYN